MRIWMMTALVLATISSTQAQRGRPAQAPRSMERPATPRADKSAEMAKELGLNKEQTEQVKAINEKHRTAMMELRKTGVEGEARNEKMKALHNEHKAALQAVLTPEQFEKLQAKGKERRAERAEKGGAKDPAKMQERAAERAKERTAKMTEALGLSKEQSVQLEAINARHAKYMADLHSTGTDDDARKARAKVLRETRDKDIKAMLTPEQNEKWIALRKEKKAESMKRHEQMKKPHNE